ncbi:DUF6113 family protein [Actinomadura sp. 7K507]|uniref:DUF6113 family protein n=1 Tax=Actinomadura sp. 7K507 TaxID=2530365 RepID=UPI00104312CB|nr:DUF6113 family protein [Actinomadura sp. 7K507]TDC81982.1 hypothetical protein E1285_31610 [Actinomadura sp. 7K507]
MDEDDESQVSLAKNGLPADGAAADPGMERPDGEAPLDAFLSGAAYAALGLLGAVFGLLGSFAQNWTAGPVPAASIVLVGLVFVMVRLAGTGMGGRLGATVPAVMWGLVAFVMSMRRPEGDLIVPGTTAGYIFIIGGMLAAVAGVMLVPAARPPGDWLLGKAARTRG